MNFTCFAKPRKCGLCEALEVLQETEKRSRQSIGAARESGSGDRVPDIASDGVMTFGKQPGDAGVLVTITPQVRPVSEARNTPLLKSASLL